MLKMERKLVKIGKVTPIEEFKGDKRDYGCTVRITWVAPNTILDEFDADLRTSFFGVDDGKNPVDVNGQEGLALPREDVELTKRKCLSVGMPLHLKKELDGYTIIFHRGATEASDIKLSEVKIDAFTADIHEGGSVLMGCNAYMKPPAEQRGHIDHTSKTEIEITLTPPTPKQQEIKMPKSKRGKKDAESELFEDSQADALTQAFGAPDGGEAA